jgi:hypothetical protein
MSATAATKEISPKLRKTIDRLQTKIKTSPDYEVHQELKAVASRSESPYPFPLFPLAPLSPFYTVSALK